MSDDEARTIDWSSPETAKQEVRHLEGRIEEMNALISQLETSAEEREYAKDARIADLEAALKPFADAFGELVGGLDEGPDTVSIWDSGADKFIKVGHLRRARAALEGKQHDNDR